ncbi:regulator of nonsense transcripts 3A isoform X2 [Cimex lectularius]|uniref:UPF3 domain-containing protein n=1 Tax=Cimex lectularius TaxID=79782 RepID=A0A8I6S6C1_CIMLE|nr:regulator of nonsense transcripts 3A isoform X2 [Cimex lectularius]
MGTECEEAAAKAEEAVKKSSEESVSEEARMSEEEDDDEEKDNRAKDNSREKEAEAEKNNENGKKRAKEDKPPTKIVIRRLPPTMTEENFIEQISPIPPFDYMYFIPGDASNGIYSFSRAYINFYYQEDIFTFTQTFDGYVFFDTKGQEYPAVVEFAPFQRIPKRMKKKDRLCGTIECDPAYIAFKENLQAEALENSKPGSTVKQHFFETEISTTEEINTTPLLEYLKQKKAEKARIKDERREEKKRKETERRMKQKIKEKRGEGEEEEPKDIKIQYSNNYTYGKSNNSEKDDISIKNKVDKVLKVNSRELLGEWNAGSKPETPLMFKPSMQGKANNKDVGSVKEIISSEKKSVENKTESKIEVTEKGVTEKTKFTTTNIDKKPDTQYTKDKLLEMLELQKAEQQSLYLQKILGICPSTPSGLSEKKVQEILKNEKTKIIISSQSHNINPSLPSASFKNSLNYSTTVSHSVPPMPQPGTPPFPYLRQNPQKTDIFKDVREIEKKPVIICNPAIVDPSIVAISEGKPLRGEVIIDKALSTNNLLPSAFKKLQNKPS